MPVLKAADLVLTKSTVGTEIAIGSEFNYTLRIDNLGPSEATEVKIEEMLPDGLQVLGLTTEPESECEIAAAVETAGDEVPSLPLMITCKPLPALQSVTLDLLVNVEAGVEPELINRASVSAAEVDPDESNNQAETLNLALKEGDLNGDGLVDILDLDSMIRELNDGDGEAVEDVAGGVFQGNALFDLNRDGVINVADFRALAGLVVRSSG